MAGVKWWKHGAHKNKKSGLVVNEGCKVCLDLKHISNFDNSKPNFLRLFNLFGSFCF